MPLQHSLIDNSSQAVDIAKWFHIKVRRRLIQSNDALVMVLTDVVH